MTQARKLRVREIVRDAPNFRSHGRTVSRPLLHLLENLQRRYGEAFASESGLRRMVWQDTGHCPGVDTIPTALERLELDGLVAQVWLVRGGIKPDGEPCYAGMRLIRVARNRQQRAAFRELARTRNRREGVSYRPNWGALRTLEQGRAELARAAAPPPSVNAREQAAERKRQEDAARLAALAEAWAREAPPGERPP